MGIRTVIVLSILAMAFAVVVLFIWLGQRQQQKKLRATARLNRERQQQTRLSKNEPAILQMNNKRVIVDPLVADGDGDDEEQGAYDDNTTSTPHVHVAEPKIVLQENESLQAGEYVSPVRIVSSSTPASAPRSSYSPPKTSSFNTRPFAVPTAAAAANNASTQTEPVIRSQIQTQTYAKYKASTQAQAPTQTQAPSFAGTSTQHQASVQSQTPFLKEPASDYQASSQTQTSPFKETSSQHQASAQAQAPSFAGTSTSSQAASQTQTSSYMGTHSQYQAASQTQSSVHSAAPAQPQFQHHQTTSEPAPKKESASLPGYLTFSLMAEKGKPFEIGRAHV